MEKNNLEILIILMTIFFILISAASAAGSEINFKNAVLTAVSDNTALKEKELQIENIKKDLEIIRARQSWKTGISAEYDEVLKEGESGAENAVRFNETPAEDGLYSISIEKNFRSGLILKPELNYTGDGRESYRLSLNYPLFPQTPTELEKNYFTISRELIQAEEEYKEMKNNKIIEWIGSYLELLRLEKNKSNLEKSLKKAVDNLETVKEEADLNEAGEAELLAAEIAFMTAENDLQNAENQLQSRRENLEIELGLKNKDRLILSDVEMIYEYFGEIENLENLSFEDLLKEAAAEDGEIKNAVLDIEILEKELEWKSREDNLSVSLNGIYDHQSEESIIGLTADYELFDGGENKLSQSQINGRIEQAERKLNDLKKEKKAELNEKLNNVNYAKKNFAKEKLSLKKSELELNNAQKNFAEGLINGSELINFEISYYNKLNLKQQAEDELLLARLNLKQTLNREVIVFDEWRKINDK
ncbi:MAG: TolC family protein [Bacillota bacterium]